MLVSGVICLGFEEVVEKCLDRCCYLVFFIIIMFNLRIEGCYLI